MEIQERFIHLQKQETLDTLKSQSAIKDNSLVLVSETGTLHHHNEPLKVVEWGTLGDVVETAVPVMVTEKGTSKKKF